jgi:hypothetical protein
VILVESGWDLRTSRALVRVVGCRMCGRSGPRRGATAVQIVWKYRRGSREIEHLGSAHAEVDVELLKAAAVQRIAAGQDELPLGTPAMTEPAALEITSTRMGRLLDAVGYAYRQLGLDVAAGRDQVFEQLVTARIIEPSSKEDAARVLVEAGVPAVVVPAR